MMQRDQDEPQGPVPSRIIVTVVDTQGVPREQAVRSWELDEGQITLVTEATTDLFQEQVIYPKGSWHRATTHVYFEEQE
jgi:hypothetical protein